MLKVINGDCIEEMEKWENKSIPLIITDLPYNVVNRSSNGLRKLDKGEADPLTFDLKIFLQQCNRVCSGSIYIFCSSEQVSEVRSSLVSFGLSTRHCIWNKTNPSPMNGQYMWLSSIENCIYAKNKGATFNEHCKGCVWNFSCGRSKIHPTEKPRALIEYLIKTSSKEGDLVADPLAGSGVCGEVSISLGRNCILVEKDPLYYSKILERLHVEKNN